MPRMLVTKATFMPSKNRGTLLSMLPTSKLTRPMKIPTNVPKTPMVVRRAGDALAIREGRSLLDVKCRKSAIEKSAKINVAKVRKTSFSKAADNI